MTGDWITSKPLEALMGVLSSSFAIVSAAGFMFLIGSPFVYQLSNFVFEIHWMPDSYEIKFKDLNFNNLDSLLKDKIL